MNNITYEEILDFIEKEIIAKFYERKIGGLNKLKTRNLLKRKNPYLFGMKNISTVEKFVTELLLAYLSSQEETLLGGLLEQLAIFICAKTYGGQKSSTKGIDLEFEKDSVKYIVAIKSGPSWGNSSQIAKMRSDFREAKRTLGTNIAKSKQVIAVNGCCYGRDDNFDKVDYLKLCGQRFWELISGDADMYARIAAPISTETERLDELFEKAYTTKVPVLVEEFQNEFCTDGKIDWAKIVKLTSGMGEPKAAKSPSITKPRTSKKLEIQAVPIHQVRKKNNPGL